MAFSFFKVLKGLLITQENTLTPTSVEIIPGGTASTTTTIQGSQTTNTTITLPDATDTLVGKNTTDTLTNKTLTSPVINTPTGITKNDVGLSNVDNTSDATKNSASVTLTNKSLSDSTTVIVDAVDATKQIKFDAAGTTGTSTTLTGSQTVNRVLTLPDATDTLIGKATTDTLTNKTLTSPVINTPTGITKSDIGLSNVDNTSDATKNAASVTLTNKTFDSTSTATGIKLANLTPDGTHTVTIPAVTDTLVGKTTTDTLTNKTLTAPVVDALTMTQITTPANPSSGSNKIYVKSDGKAYSLSSGGVESKIGGGLSPWVASTVYSLSDVVTYEKQAYICLTNNTSASTFETDIASGYWQLLNLNVNGRNYALVGNNFEDGDAGGWATCTLGIQYTFTVTSANATIGAVYSDGSHSYTVVNTIAGSTSLVTSGTANPFTSGTLTKVSGTGDATIAFSTWASLPYQSGAVPVTFVSSGATSIQTLTATSTNPISGKFSLNVANTTSTNFTAGQGIISQVFSIDNIDQAKVLANKFAYQAAAGSANMNFSGSSSNTWAAYIFDVTNNAWIQPAGVYNLVQGSGVGISAGTWQTPANMTQFRIALLCINSSTASTPAAGALQMNLDDFYIGPQATVSAPAMSDWQPLNGVTSSWTSNTTVTAKYKQVGDVYELDIGLALTGAPNATPLTLNLPFTVDTSKMSSASNLEGRARVVAAATTFQGTVQLNSATQIGVYVLNSTGTYDSQATLTNTAPATFTNGDYINVRVSYPVVGKSSNSVMSNDTDTRVVSCVASNQLPTGSPTGSFANLKLASITKDTHSAYNPSTGGYTAPSSGFYRISSTVEISGAFAANQYIGMSVGNQTLGTIHYAYTKSQVVVTTSYTVNLSGTIYANAGDSLAIQCISNGSSLSFTTALSGSSLSIERLSGPAVIAASESVNARYTNVSGQSISNVGTTTVTGWTKDFDTHGAFNPTTGIYTAPISGTYQISASLFWTGATMTAGQFRAIELYKNGAFHSYLNNIYIQTTVTTFAMHNGSVLVKLVAGDTISIVAAQNESTARALDTSAGGNYVNIIKVGN